MKVCPRCQSDLIRKSGVVKFRQRYKCKICNYHFTVKQIGKPVNKKRDALVCYLLGFDYRTCGKLLDINHATAYQWIKQLGVPINQLKSGKPSKTSSLALKKYVNKVVKEKKSLMIIGNIGEEDMSVLYI